MLLPCISSHLRAGAIGGVFILVHCLSPEMVSFVLKLGGICSSQYCR